MDGLHIYGLEYGLARREPGYITRVLIIPEEIRHDLRPSF